MPTNHEKRLARCGSVYLAVTGVAMILSLIGFTAMHLARLELRVTTDSQSQSMARIYAMSAVELALAQIEEFPDWRTDFDHGVKYARTPNLYGGPLYFKLLDDDNGLRNGGDGDLADDPTEAVEIRGIGHNGNALAIYSVSFAPATHELRSYTTGSNTTDDVINFAAWFGQYFLPDLPKVAVSWTVTSIEVKVKDNGNSSQKLDIGLNLPDGSLYPGTLLETLSVNADDLPSIFEWREFSFNNVTDLDPKVGLCLTLTSEDGNSSQIEYDQAGVTASHTHMLSGGNSNWTSIDADKSLYYRIHGYYITQSGGRGAFTITSGSWKTVEAQ